MSGGQCDIISACPPTVSGWGPLGTSPGAHATQPVPVADGSGVGASCLSDSHARVGVGYSLPPEPPPPWLPGATKHVLQQRTVCTPPTPIPTPRHMCVPLKEAAKPCSVLVTPGVGKEDTQLETGQCLSTSLEHSKPQGTVPAPEDNLRTLSA